MRSELLSSAIKGVPPGSDLRKTTGLGSIVSDLWQRVGMELSSRIFA